MAKLRTATAAERAALTNAGSLVGANAGPVRGRSRRALLAMIPMMLLVVVVPALDAAPTRAASAPRRAFFVDPRTGADTNPGSRAHPWRTLARVSSATLHPGDRVLLRRGTRQIGELTIDPGSHGSAGHRITIGAYGRSGRRPTISQGHCVTVLADYVTLQDVRAANCGGQGFRYGIDLKGAHDVAQRVEATGNYIGIAIDHASVDAQVRNSYIHANNQMIIGPGCNDDGGAQGITVSGLNARIVGNRIDDQGAPSSDYGMDGSAIELYGAVGTRVLRNRAHNDIVFSELGPDSSTGRSVADTLIAYNQVTSSRDATPRTLCGRTQPEPIRTFFMLVRGTSSDLGGSQHVDVVHNSVYLSGVGATGIYCADSCQPSTLDVEANILDAEIPGSVDTGVNGFVHHDNIIGTTTSADLTRTWGPASGNADRERYCDPMFANPAVDLRLAARSPAVAALNAPWPGLTRDVAGHVVPRSGGVDIGAWERAG